MRQYLNIKRIIPSSGFFLRKLKVQHLKENANPSLYVLSKPQMVVLITQFLKYKHGHPKLRCERFVIVHLVVFRNVTNYSRTLLYGHQLNTDIYHILLYDYNSTRTLIGRVSCNDRALPSVQGIYQT